MLRCGSVRIRIRTGSPTVALIGFLVASPPLLFLTWARPSVSIHRHLRLGLIGWIARWRWLLRSFIPPDRLVLVVSRRCLREHRRPIGKLRTCHRATGDKKERCTRESRCCCVRPKALPIFHLANSVCSRSAMEARKCNVSVFHSFLKRTGCVATFAISKKVHPKKIKPWGQKIARA